MPQNRLFLLATSIFYSFIAFCQSNDSLTYYFDSGWKACDISEAMYYRKCLWKDKKLGVVDYYMSTKTPQMIGYFKDKSAQLRIDTVIYFSQYGNVTMTGKYVNDTAEGFWVNYFDDGKKESEGSYERGKQNGKWIYYHINGMISSLEIYQGDSLKKMRCWDSLGSAQSICYENQPPEFPGGVENMMEFLTNRIEYPAILRESGIEGRVLVQFIIDTSGVLYDLKVVNYTYPEFKEEALRVVRLMPRWTYYPNHNRMLPVKLNLPIVFKLI